MGTAEGGDAPGRSIDGVCRDVLTLGGGTTKRREARVSISTTNDRLLRRIDTSPAANTSPLLGRFVGHGFRALLAETVPDDAAADTPLFLLLDELPVGSLISGYADLYADRIPADRQKRQDGSHISADICSGWRSDGLMIRSLREHGRMPVPLGPDDVPIAAADDPDGWHEIGPLPRDSMRRRRLVDVGQHPDDPELLAVFATFRDTHHDPDGRVHILHEYSVRASVDVSSMVVRECAGTAHVLPWDECPAAVASAERLAGQSLHDVRILVQKTFRGTSVCTHLNDLLRSLGSVPKLWESRHLL